MVKCHSDIWTPVRAPLGISAVGALSEEIPLNVPRDTPQELGWTEQGIAWADVSLPPDCWSGLTLHQALHSPSDCNEVDLSSASVTVTGKHKGHREAPWQQVAFSSRMARSESSL